MTTKCNAPAEGPYKSIQNSKRTAQIVAENGKYVLLQQAESPVMMRRNTVDVASAQLLKIDLTFQGGVRCVALHSECARRKASYELSPSLILASHIALTATAHYCKLRP